MISKNKTGVNLIGCGYWGEKIKRSLDSMQISINIIDSKFNTSFDNLVKEWPAIVATPTETHYTVSEFLIKNNYDVLIEKPVATNEYEIQSLKNLQNQKQIIMAGHLFLYNPMLYKLKDILDDLGELKFIQCTRLNFGRYQSNIDVLHNIAFHDFTILQYLFENIVINKSIGFDLSNNKTADRHLVVGTANGIPFQIDASWLSVSRQRTITLCGTKGQAVWDSDKNTIEVTYFTLVPELEKISTLIIHNVDASPLELELEHFLNCVSEKIQPNSTLDHALKIEKLINYALTNRN